MEDSQHVKSYKVEYCPLKKSMAKVNDSRDRIVRAMQQLRRDLKTCKRCKQAPECAFLNKYNESIREALEEATKELGLTA
jgi:hypothetical protein